MIPRRAAALQSLGVGVAAAALWWLGWNASVSLARHGIALGFGFLRQPANFEIGEHWLRYGPEASFARAILVGLVNTAAVSAAGCILAIALGFLLGLLRLSGSAPLRGLVRAGVELMRGIPLLLLLLFLAATIHALPAPRLALRPVAGFFLSDRGLVLPVPQSQPIHLWLGALLAVTLVIWRRLGRRGAMLATAAAVGLVASLVLVPPGWDVARLQGFNLAGGLTLSPEFTALLAALVLHHAAHVSEVVRGAVLAVSSGQRDAAAALGLSRRQALRLVVVPQALRAMVPLLANNCVSLTKNSSLAVAVGFPDVVSILNTAANQTGHVIETMLLMIGVYLTLSLAVAGAMNRYNARLLRPAR